MSIEKGILKKIANYCAYQERTHSEVIQKLKEFKVWGDDTEETLAWLVTENYVNEERFAKIYAGSKFRVKNWGRKKILFELKAKNLSSYCINVAMKEISEKDYLKTIKELISKKSKELALEKNTMIKQQKIAKYLIGKGFESDLVFDILNINSKN